MSSSAFAEEADQAASLLRIGAGLLAALVTVQLLRPWWNPVTDAPSALPIILALAVVAAGLATYLLVVRVRLVDNPRLRWVIAALGLSVTTLLYQAAEATGLTQLPELLTPSAVVAMTWVRHAAIGILALGAVLAPDAHRLRQALTWAFALLIVLVQFEPTWEVLPTIVEVDGLLTDVHRWGTAATVVVATAAAVVYVLGSGRRAARPDVYVVLMLVLTAIDAAVGWRATTFPGWLWWNLAVLRSAPFVILAFGLLVDNARLVGLLRRHERGLQDQLAREVDRAVEAGSERLTDAGAGVRIDQLLREGAFTPVFQPIVDIRTGATFAVEALTRFTDEPRRSPDVWFDEAHTVGRGMELELATLAAALDAVRALPADIAVSVNVSPTTLLDRRLLTCLDVVDEQRPVIVEITEHAPVADYGRLDEVRAELRARDIRLAVDDAGAGFSSLRHVVRLRPDLLKLDMSLTRGIHMDPVRHALAASLVDFARRTGVTLIAEGVEEEAELTALTELGVDAAQGYLLSRPLPVEQLAVVLARPQPVGH